ncbi:hypothetical protein Nepgr_001812 [Nepenthes gracilis]|uniref:Uncharacterized protein n=1 Tax=Nepenthes gracilis TaxID=150966 RepID=A0AAD3RXW0_NEPGR|nr:hypothetical protein Nepgr_001812 [Nepenthes gracilis]
MSERLLVAEVEAVARDSELFPIGLRVLVVDDNAACLTFLTALLEKCHYRVTATTKAAEVLNILQQNPSNFDIIIMDVHTIDKDGFTLPEIIDLEMGIPIIMVSDDDDKDTVMKCIMSGACDFLIKPVRIEELQNIWQHVYRKRMSNPRSENAVPSRINGRKSSKMNIDSDAHVDTEVAASEVKISVKKKKRRIRWGKELHGKFVEAVNLLGGVDKAVPKEILESMNVREVTRESVASHLQKYRNASKKQKLGVSAEEENLDDDPNKALLVASAPNPRLCINHMLQRKQHSAANYNCRHLSQEISLQNNNQFLSFGGGGGGGGPGVVLPSTADQNIIVPSFDFGMNSFFNFNGGSWQGLEDSPFGSDPVGEYVCSVMG